MATDTQSPVVPAKGGSFLIEDRAPDEVFTPEDLSEEQRMIADTATEFMQKDVVPRLPELLEMKYEATRELFRKAGDLGLLGIEIPEEYGGLGLDKVSATLAAEQSARLFRESSEAVADHLVVERDREVEHRRPRYRR